MKAGFDFQTEPFKQRIKDFRKAQRKKTPKSFFQIIPESHFHSSQVALRHLSRVSLLDLTVDLQAKGSHLLLRTLTFPVMEKTLLKSVVEDHLGNVTLFYLAFAYDPDKFSADSFFVLKEPFLLVSKFALICYSPSDIIVIDEASKLRGMVREISWITVLPESKKSPKTATDWKALGTRYFAKKAYTKALEAFLVALDMSLEDEKLTVMLNMNIANTYFKLECYESSLSYALKVSNNGKAFYRAGCAYYELREFEKSAYQFKKVQLLEPRNKSASEWLKKCLARVKEQKGYSTQEINRIFLLSVTNPSACVDCADFIGDITIRSSPNTRCSVVANKDIAPGTILVVSKAYYSLLDQSSGRDSFINAFREIIQHVVKRIMKNPNSFGKEIYDLWRACSKTKEVQQYCEEDDQELAVDIGRMVRFLQKTCYRVHSFPSRVASYGFFIYPIYFKQSEDPNSDWQIYNDVMIIRAVTYIARGEEVKLDDGGLNII